MDNLARDILSVNEDIAGRHATVAGGADGGPEMIWGSPEMGAVLDLVAKGRVPPGHRTAHGRDRDRQVDAGARPP
jgi:hypothetical protein